MEAQNKYSPLLPVDKDGFTVSFDIHSFDPKQVQEFYNLYGFVVYNNVINEEEVNRTIDDLWDDLRQISSGKVQRNAPETWGFERLRSLGSYGFVNNKPLSRPQIWKNRQNANVYKAFKRSYELSSGKQLDEPLVAQFDRGSLLRPSKLNPEWIGQSIHHFDIHPWYWTKEVPSSRNNWRKVNDYNPEYFQFWLGEGNYTPYVGYTKLAGVLALSDTNERSGGFECVCGFQNHIHQWTKQHKTVIQITMDPDLMANFQRVFQRKGSLLVFSRELPHNIYPNVSENFRYAQYLRMSPLSALSLGAEEVRKRKECVKFMLPSYVQVQDQISQEIFMLNKYQPEEQPEK